MREHQTCEKEAAAVALLYKQQAGRYFHGPQLWSTVGSNNSSSNNVQLKRRRGSQKLQTSIAIVEIHALYK